MELPPRSCVARGCAPPRGAVRAWLDASVVNARPGLTPRPSRGVDIDEVEVDFRSTNPDCRAADVPARQGMAKNRRNDGFQFRRRGPASATAAPEDI